MAAFPRFIPEVLLNIPYYVQPAKNNIRFRGGGGLAVYTFFKLQSYTLLLLR